VSNTLTYRKAEWNNFFLSLNSQFVTEQTRFPDNNFDVRIINRTTGEFEDVLLDISTPPKAYHLLNLKSGMQFDWGEKQLSVNLLVNNVLNTSYRSYLNALRFYADEVGTNAMLQLKLNY
jgi:iron complex outermembrane receptor protein